MTATASTSPATPATDHDEHRFLYWLIGIVVVVLAIIGLITYSGKKQSADASAKATQLTQAFQQAGLPVPADQDIITRSLGNDGGAVCDNPASALGRATLFDQLYNGAATVGRRPVIADTNVLKGELLILDTYCPEKVQQYRDKTQDLKTDDTIGN
jgi:hypothetical protein